MRKEVRGVCNQHDQAALNLGEPPDVCELQQQRSSHTHDDTNHQATEKDEQEDTRGLDEADETVASGIGLLVLLGSLEDDNGDGIIENGFAEDDGIQFGINLVSVENGNDSDRIGRRECCANGDGVYKGHLRRAGDLRENPKDKTDDNCREESTGERKGQDRAKVSKEVGLV